MNRLGVYNRALECHQRSYEINKALNNRAGIAWDYQNIGWLYSRLREFTNALEYHYKSLMEYQKLGDKAGIARENSYIGLALSKLSRHDEALKHHGSAIALDKEIANNEKWRLAEDYQNMASALYDMRSYSNALEYYKTSLEHYNDIGGQARYAILLEWTRSFVRGSW